MRAMDRSIARAASAALLLLAACGGSEPNRPNVILVSIDSLRPDHLHCYGYARETSPTIDALAAGGVRFENAVSTTSWTLPAHAALFTGLYDSTHGLFDNGLRLAEEHRTLAEELRELGYHTAGFFGGPYLHPTFGLGDGFDVYTSCMTAVAPDLNDEQMRAESRAPDGSSHDDVTSPRTIEEVARWSASRPADRPFFLFVHLWDVHYDFLPPPPFDRMFDPDYTGSIDGRGFMSRPEVRPQMDARDLEHLKALYDGEIRSTDEALGKILAGLREKGLLENALVIVTADHGEEFFEHGGKGHQKTLFDEVLRIPLVVSWPGVIDAGRVVTDQVRIVDIAPTILAAAGARAVPAMQGRDVSPLARGEALAPAAALCELHADKRDFRALRTNEFKVIDFGQAPDGRELPTVGFDLAADPWEREPMRLQGDERVRAAREKLDATRESALALRKYLGARSQHAPIDAELERKLRETGYLGEAKKDE
jgi:arylsulfatase A-like enzyme